MEHGHWFAIIWLICIAVFGLISCEIYLRYAGIGSYPIYVIDNDIKYIPAANQHGRFRNRNDWYFNDRHMGNISNWRPERHPNVLLIGDSIVFGGNPFNHHDKLGPLLEKDLGATTTVWSVAASAWTNVNEMVYLDRNPDVLQNADTVIIEYMSDGLAAANPWPGYYVFPDHKAWLLTSYIFRRNVLAPLLERITSAFGSVPVTGATDAAQLQRFKMLISSVSSKRNVVIFMYPMISELRDNSSWLAATAPVRHLCQENAVICIDVAREPTWGESAYQGDGVHPTVAGNKVLASILAKAVTNKSAL
jgi:lysophospholipase L1-like esterase